MYIFFTILFVLGTQDGDSVTAGWERFKSTSHGLRIKEVILDDSGEYTCKGNVLPSSLLLFFIFKPHRHF